MNEKLVEQVARALAVQDGIQICSDASYPQSRSNTMTDHSQPYWLEPQCPRTADLTEEQEHEAQWYAEWGHI